MSHFLVAFFATPKVPILPIAARDVLYILSTPVGMSCNTVAHILKSFLDLFLQCSALRKP